jgi:tRNA-specific 2-thiouridylase
MLYTLTQDELARALFPLGELTKEEARDIAASKGFVNAKKPDSQDICFVLPEEGKRADYGAFLERRTGKTYPEGDIVDEQGRVLGRHRGLPRYTIGQRRRLGVAANQPLYVKSKDAASNTLVLAPEASLYSKGLAARDINLIACDSLETPARLTCKTRYRQEDAACVACQVGTDELRIEFDEPAKAVTTGQACVLYDGETVVGGGTIVAALDKERDFRA